MKKSFILISFTAFLLSSCVITIEGTSGRFNDEIYYSVNEYAEVEAQEKAEWEEYQATHPEEFEQEQELYVEEFDSDDQYDYYYASRLRRFHSPYVGFGYYNNYYTNSFWYSSNLYHCGVSIYYGYNFWNPGYYDPWYTGHHYGWGHHYHYAGNPYWHGYYDGMYLGGYYPTYFNSYDNNSVYYGVRQNNNKRTPERFANKYETEVVNNPNRFQRFVNEKEEKIPAYSGARTPYSPAVRPTSTQRPGSTQTSYDRGRVNNNVNSNSNRQPLQRPSINSNIDTTPQKRPNRTNSTPPKKNNNSSYSKPSRSSNSSYTPSRSSRSRSSSPSRNSGGGNSRSPR